MENIDTFTGLARRLELDLRFRYQCGLRLDISAPSISTLSRVFAELTHKSLPGSYLRTLWSKCQEAWNHRRNSCSY
ncbi:transposase [Paenibacillus sp. RS8]|uniref:transposase n=1 Tax=Paenibacillus sp. RS8 TaxID=3242681 RepID=UPI0035BF03A3